MFEDGRHLGAPAAVHELRQGGLLRFLEEQACERSIFMRQSTRSCGRVSRAKIGAGALSIRKNWISRADRGRGYFRAVQPSGNLHIGNYLGALANWVRIQHDYESIFCIVDLHAITVYQKPDELRGKIRQNWRGCSSPRESIRRNFEDCSTVETFKAHAELAWMLTCVTPVGWLERRRRSSRRRRRRRNRDWRWFVSIPRADGGGYSALSGCDCAGGRGIRCSIWN